jgi:acyl dehydratase
MRALQDLRAGAVLNAGRIGITAEAIQAFAAAYDPQVQHLDDAAARLTPLRGVAASGWHTCSLLTQQVKRRLKDWSIYLELPAIEGVRWLQPVRPNEVLEVVVRWNSNCTSPGCSASSGWSVTIEALNQAGDLVLRMNGNALLSTTRSSRDALRRHALRCARHLQRTPRTERRPGGHLVRYFEEVELGDEIALGHYDFTEAAVKSYSSIVDGRDEISAPEAQAHAEPPPGIANNWHVIGAWMRGIVDYYHTECEWLAARQRPVPVLGPAAGAHALSWCTPVRIGDRITFTSWAEHKVHLGTSSEWGLLIAGAEGVNQDGEVVVSFYPQFLLQKRLTQAIPRPPAPDRS